jgi:hypothetical protein
MLILKKKPSPKLNANHDIAHLTMMSSALAKLSHVEPPALGKTNIHKQGDKLPQERRTHAKRNSHSH